MTLNLNRNEIYDKVISIIAQQLNISKNNINPEINLEDLGSDSLDRVEIIMKLEEEFEIEISDEDAEKINNLEQIVDYIINLKK